MVGKTLGHYEILGSLGAGGMGEVYRARDTILKREVAIKVLPEDLADDPDRLARLEREAHLLASMNHPNIATIHSLEREQDTRFLVLELVKGESLEQRLTKGPLTVDKGLDFGKQIAEALEAAHGEGIIHRDLKPANVVITPDGRAKVLDFGIAKTVATGSLAAESEVTNLTVAGTLVGTVPYMSPEQVRGQDIDKRADIWAFGCLLYEMLSGGHAFARETVADTLAAIIEQEPDWEALPTSIPVTVRTLLHRCLQKDPKLRLRDIGDAWVEMNAILSDPSGVAADTLGIAAIDAASVVTEQRSTALWIAAAMVGGALLGVVGAWAWLGEAADRNPPPLQRVAIVVPDRERISGDIALSRDGRDIVYVADAGGSNRLYHRPMSALAATELPGTDGAEDPFFSPDGESVGFFVGSDLHKVSLSEGRVLTVCTDCARGKAGAVWLEDDTIVFSSTRMLFRVSADGDAPTLLAAPGADEATVYRFPAALPGGQGILLEVQQENGRRDIGVLPADTEDIRILEESGRRPMYSSTGHVVFWREQTLFALPIDPQSGHATGQPQPVIDGLPVNYQISDEGTLIHRGTSVRSNSVMLVDFEGNATRLPVDYKLYWDVRLSPDQRSLALSGQDSGSGQRIWVYDLTRPTIEPQPIHFEGEGRYPVWSPDGTRVAFSWGAAAAPVYWVTPTDPNKIMEALTTIAGRPGSFSPDGTVLAFRGGGVETGRDIMLLPMQGDKTPTPFIATPAAEGTPRFSPDGHWLTYTSNFSGQYEVYVTPYPGPASEHQVSQGGGQNAVWAHDGKTIYYRQADRMMAVAFDAEPEMRTGDPEFLFEGRYDGAQPDTRARYDIGPEGAGFVMLTVPEAVWPNTINIVLNWVEELKPPVPPGASR